MRSKERAADIGKAERRVLQPEMAHRMDRMNAVKRAEFEKQVQQVVENIVYTAKRRYVRRQEKLDDAGIFHPEANAHRVHTQFWADLNNNVNITKIENEVWARMAADAERGGSPPQGSPHNTTSTLGRRTPAIVATSGSRTTVAVNDSESARPSSKDSSRQGAVGGSSKAVAWSDDDAAKDACPPTSNDAALSAPSSETFAGILGYDELGHVPTLDEFRSEWPKLKSRGDLTSLACSGENNRPRGTSRWEDHANGRRQQQQQQCSGSVVNELSKRDEVFRHFKKYYDKADHLEGRPGDALFPAGVCPTGVLQPDFEVVEAVGRHTAQAQESRCRSRIGEGVLCQPGGGSDVTRKRLGGSDRTQRRSREGTGDLGDGVGHSSASGGDGFTNVFRESMLGGDGRNETPPEGSGTVSFPHSKRYANRASTGSRRGNGDTSSSAKGTSSGTTGPTHDGKRVRGIRPGGSVWGVDSVRAKASSEGSSTSAELQARLEASWRALHVPARLKLDFLQKYCTVQRILDLPKTAFFLETASKAVPLREKVGGQALCSLQDLMPEEWKTKYHLTSFCPPFRSKVIDYVRRIEDDGESMTASSVFSPTEEGVLYELNCWEQFDAIDERVLRDDSSSNDRDDDFDADSDGGGEGKGSDADNDAGDGERDEEFTEEARRQAQRRRRLEKEARRKAAESLLAWLTSIESKLAHKCAEVCDTAWYDLGETITYKGRPVAYTIPTAVMEAAIKRREDGEDRTKHGRRAR
ncbi:unnamed protein product [Ectocarpus sp. CCAP 1310/34]|nr:unnamed protein product [Ectocarpus sp. CCAP 1310/34]